MDSPICGIGTSTRAMTCAPESRWLLIAREILAGAHDVIHLGEEVILQRRRVRHGCIERGHPQHGRVQPLESMLAHTQGYFSSNTAGASVLVDDEQAMGLANTVQKRL